MCVQPLGALVKASEVSIFFDEFQWFNRVSNISNSIGFSRFRFFQAFERNIYAWYFLCLLLIGSELDFFNLLCKLAILQLVLFELFDNCKILNLQ
jgi:hypothetical protein